MKNSSINKNLFKANTKLYPKQYDITINMLNEPIATYDALPSNQKLSKINMIRNGVSFESIEVISKRINRPVKSVLSILDMPQTTYNKKKNENSRLDHRNSELIILISELIDYGTIVFNNELEKFQRWLKKPNSSLGGHVPESLLDTVTGIQEVKNALHRLEYGNFA